MWVRTPTIRRSQTCKRLRTLPFRVDAVDLKKLTLRCRGRLSCRRTQILDLTPRKFGFGTNLHSARLVGGDRCPALLKGCDHLNDVSLRDLMNAPAGPRLAHLAAKEPRNLAPGAVL